MVESVDDGWRHRNPFVSMCEPRGCASASFLGPAGSA